MPDRYDVIVVGAGPAGYVAAIRCAQLGFKTVCIDEGHDADGQPALGGTCLNVGCIPSKALLESSELYERSQADFARHGLLFDQVVLDLDTMMQRKVGIIKTLNQGVSGLLKANGVTQVLGRARLMADRQVEITGLDGGATTQRISADHVILATGSRPVDLAVAPVDHEYIVDSSGALTLDHVPKRLGIIGAGVIGLELGSVWRRLGSEVVLLEAQETFLCMADRQIAAEGHRYFTQQGLDIRLAARVTGSRVEQGAVTVQYQNAQGDHEMQCDRLVVAVGREANTHGVLSRDCGVRLGACGLVIVDDACCSNVPGVYAIGDMVRGPMLAHKGSEEGIMVAERIAGHAARVDYGTIPSVVYTHPEIAWVGKNEEEVKALGIDYRVGSFPFSASGRAMAQGDTRGLIKVIADRHTDRVLGVHMIGAHCSELIAEAVIAMQFQASSEDLAMTMFAHPSLSEALHEAALDVTGLSIHKVSKKRS